MTLREQMANDVVAILNTGEFAETVTYVPYRYFGEEARADRSIVAVIERESISQVVGDEATVLPVYRVSVANDATTGIASSEIDVGSDYIDIPPRDGKTAARVTITQLLEQDPAMLVLQCQ
jgi:hypothetical protein